jgi:hypothetical protein
MTTKDQAAFDQLVIEQMRSDIGRAGLHMKELVACIAEGRTFRFVGIEVVVVPASGLARQMANDFSQSLK